MQLVFLVREITPYWQQFLEDFSAAWKSFGALTVISSGEKSDELHPWEGKVAAGLEVLVVPPLSDGKCGGTIWPTTAVWHRLDKLKPAVVVIQEYSPYVVIGGLLWAKANRRPCIVTSDVGPVQRQQLSPVQRLTHRLVNALVDGVLARTQDAYDQATVGNKPRLLAPHAIDTRFYGAARPIRAKPKRIIQVGSLIPRKGIDLLLEAMVLVRQYKPEAELVLVGAGDHAGTRKLAGSLGVEACVSMRNFLQTHELVEEYLNSDVFVLASRFDSYGVVTHEAAAAGLPLVVSRNAGSSATLVEPGENGFQVDPEDRAALAEAILNCLDSAHNRTMSEKSREIARKNDSKFLATKTANWLAQFDPGTETTKVGLSSSLWGTAAAGLGRIGLELLRKPTLRMTAWLAPDAFESARREIVFLNRYIPFYREAIFRRVAQWKTTILLYSGHTLGNLRGVQSVESEALGTLRHPGTGNIIWLRAASKLWKVRPKVVCTELSLSLLSTWWLLVLRRIFGFGLVFWTHGFQEYGWKNRQLGWKDRLRLWWMHQADAVIFYGKSRMLDVIEIGGERPHYFLAPNTLDTTAYAREYAALSEEGREAVRRRLGLTNRAMVYVGRLDPEKEVMGLVDLLEATRNCHQPPTLIVIGGGGLEASLRGAITQDADRVRLVGPVFDLVEKAAWIFASEVMVCPGYAGLNVVDALALGCPFATVAERNLRRRHSPEITYVEHGLNGLVAEDLNRLGTDLRSWFDQGSPIRLSSDEINRKFMHESKIDHQFEGMQRAFRFAMSKFSIQANL